MNAGPCGALACETDGLMECAGCLFCCAGDGELSWCCGCVRDLVMKRIASECLLRWVRGGRSAQGLAMRPVLQLPVGFAIHLKTEGKMFLVCGMCWLGIMRCCAVVCSLESVRMNASL